MNEKCFFVLIQIEKEITWRSDAFLRGTGNDNGRRTRAPTPTLAETSKKNCTHALYREQIH